MLVNAPLTFFNSRKFFQHYGKSVRNFHSRSSQLKLTAVKLFVFLQKIWPIDITICKRNLVFGLEGHLETSLYPFSQHMKWTGKGWHLSHGLVFSVLITSGSFQVIKIWLIDIGVVCGYGLTSSMAFKKAGLTIHHIIKVNAVEW